MKLSIVIPFYREADNVQPLFAELVPILEATGDAFEILPVDDGSDDQTPRLLAELAARDARIRPIYFRRNHGQSAALAAGFARAQGELVVTMDGDLQCDPAEIPRLVAFADRFDCITGQRARRRDSLVRRLSSRAGNGIRNLLTGHRVADTGSPLKVIRRSFLARIPTWNGMHRFLPTLLVRIAGARLVEVPVNHRPRLAGRSKYGIGNRALRGLRDCLGVRWLIARRLAWHGDAADAPPPPAADA